jgi:hypothetical protein
MISLNEYWEDLIENVQLDFNSKLIPPASAFFERTTNTLVQVGDLDKEVYTGFSSDFAFNGFAFRLESGTLQLISVIYSPDEQKGLLKAEIESVFKRLEKLITFISKKKYQNNSIEETSEFYDCCSEIYNLIFKDEVKEIQFILITDSNLPKSMYHIENKSVGQIQYSYSVYDINYFYQIHKNGNQYASFVLDTNLPCLTVNNNSNNDYVSFLTVISGKELASIYGKYKSKLLEENVRTFLQFRGDVNKGIRYTLQNKPDYFFAYNNGITATATDVEIEKNCIVRIDNLQIVNGGQTTASIYAASEKYKVDLSEVNVPMKLSVVRKVEIHSTFVSNVAEYANTQNKVNKSDFFSNHKYHLDMKKISSRLWVNRVAGSQVSSRWFYERVRGEYLNEQSHLNKTELKKFLLEYPKHQYIDKLDLAKSENAWLKRPYYSALGAQGSFVKFSEFIIEEMDKNENLVTDNYFKSAISRLLIFWEIERIISKSSWYTGGFRAQTVAYTLAALSYISEKFGKMHFNFEAIWENQAVPDDLIEELDKIAMSVHLSLLSPNSRFGNVSVFAKKKDCWERVKRINFDNIEIGQNYFIDQDEFKQIIKEGIKINTLDKELDIEILVYKTDYKVWAKLKNFYLNERLSDFQIRTLKKYSLANKFIPTRNESNTLYKLLIEAKKSGFSE